MQQLIFYTFNEN